MALSFSTQLQAHYPNQRPANQRHAMSNSQRQAHRQSWSDIGFGQLSTYSKQDILGSGTYSIVYKGTSKLTNRAIALKEIHLIKDEGVPFTALREVSLLKNLKHNNVITLHDIIYTEKVLTLVFEYVDRHLGKYMDECKQHIHPNNVTLLLFQLLRALSYCHSQRILHRDIKPPNILICSNGDLKLADFGLARAKGVPTKTFSDEVVTLWYRPPDVLLGNTDYGTSIDMWGVGCIFFEIAAGHTLFRGRDSRSQLECIFDITGTPNNDSWPGIESDEKFQKHCCDMPVLNGRDLQSLAPRLSLTGIDLLGKFLQCDPKARIPAGDAMHHDLFSLLPSEIYELDNCTSIFSIPSVQFVPTEGSFH